MQQLYFVENIITIKTIFQINFSKIGIPRSTIVVEIDFVLSFMTNCWI